MSEHDEMPQDERISALYRMGEGREPPAHLDEAIRREAQREIRRRRQRILWPSLATAAVLVLSFTLVLQVQDQGGLDGMPMPMERERAAPPSAPRRQPEAPMTAAPQAEGGVATSAVADEAALGAVAPQQERKTEADKLKKLSETAEPELQLETVPAVPADAESDRMMESATLSEKGEASSVQEQMHITVTGYAAPACDEVLPKPDATPEEWERVYARLLEEQKEEQAKCLRQQFRARFGRDLPGAGAGAEKPDL